MFHNILIIKIGFQCFNKKLHPKSNYLVIVAIYWR